MRHWSKIKEAMKNRSKYSYIKSPVGIILAINTGLFVYHLPILSYGGE